MYTCCRRQHCTVYEQVKCYDCMAIPPIAIRTVTHSSVIHRVFWCTHDSHLRHTVVPLIIDFTVCHDMATITQLLVAMCTVAMCTHTYMCIYVFADIDARQHARFLLYSPLLLLPTLQDGCHSCHLMGPLNSRIWLLHG